MDTESKQVLDDLFAILGFSEKQKEGSLLMFKKKIAEGILNRVKSELPEEYRQFIEKEGAGVTDPNHPMIAPIHEALKKLHTDEEFHAMTHEILKNLLPEYVIEVSKLNVGADVTEKLEKRIKEFS